MVCVPTQERGNEIKYALVSSFPRSCVGMHICVMNILLPAVLKKLQSQDVVRLSLTENRLVQLSIEDAIKKLKAEIIAQDWRLSPKRAAGLEEAFQCLRQRFKSRRATNAMLVMAGSVLDYIKKRGGTPPETIDFLKESMAHVVNLYEDLIFDPEKEEQLFAGLFKRFQRLKGKIKTGEGVKATGPAGAVDINVSVTEAKIATGRQVEERVAGAKVETLIEDLRNSLDKAGEASTEIGRILAEASEPHGVQLLDDRDGAKVTSLSAPLDSAPKEVSGTTVEENNIEEDKTELRASLQSCPPTELREISINGIDLSVPAEFVALVRPLKKNRLTECLRTSQVPLKYFSGFMQKLSRLFSGTLATIKENKLKKVILPIIMPQSLDFTEIPDPHATTLVVLSSGNWHGVLACAKVSNEICMMKKIQRQKNGDILGLAHLEDGRQLMLLDAQGILRREGFLLIT